METFTLIMWITIADKTEVSWVQDLTVEQCLRREMGIALRLDPQAVRTRCVPTELECLVCAWPRR
ncbi:MAG: hypothetical protein EHM35_01160 [Planctomycetaceae bacterium]|nr:MAG: hypothetical protein EHM35_21435 [Planctomycetaceae bacterium]RPJ39872.1 MAG: hypothetical protein EHM35_01160 [Planctomycetaceae bacterium]